MSKVALRKKHRCVVITDTDALIVDPDEEHNSQSVTYTWREDISYGEDDDKEKLKKDRKNKKLIENKTAVAL